MNEQPKAPSPAPASKAKQNMFIVACLVVLGVIGAGSRVFTSMKLDSASAEAQEVERLVDSLDNIRQDALGELDSNPDAVWEYQQKHTQQLEDYRAANPNDTSMDAFITDFVLSSNKTAPDTSIVGEDLEWIMDFSNVQSRAELVRRAGRLRELDAVLVDMSSWISDLPGNFEAELNDSDFPVEIQNKAKKVFLYGFDTKGRLKIQELDRRLLRTVNQMLEVLHLSWGEWTYDSNAEQIVFEDDEAVVKFNQLFDSMIDLAEQQQVIQRRILTAADRYPGR